MLKIFLKILFLRKYENTMVIIEDYAAPNFHFIDYPDLQQGSLCSKIGNHVILNKNPKINREKFMRMRN